MMVLYIAPRFPSKWHLLVTNCPLLARDSLRAFNAAPMTSWSVSNSVSFLGAEYLAFLFQTDLRLH